MIRVYVDNGAGQVPKEVPHGEVPGDVPIEVPPTSQSQVPAGQAQAEALTSLIQTSIVSVLGPLVGEIAAARQTNERQTETIHDQAEQLGKLTERLDHMTAELETLRAQTAALLAPTATQSTEPTQTTPGPWWRRWLTAAYG